MNTRYLKRFLLLVAGLAVVWFCWPRHAVKPLLAHRTPIAAKPAATVVSAVKSPASLFVRTQAGTNGVAGGLRSTNKFALRLTNTTKSLGELSHDAHAILLANALIDTRASLNLRIPSQLKSKGDPGAYIVQANGATTPAFRSMVAAAGGQIISYIPNNAYLVRATADQVAVMAGTGEVGAVVPYEPYYKISSGLLAQAVQQQPLAADALVNLGVFAQDAAATEAAVEKMGGEILATDVSPFGPIFRVSPPADWTALAQLPGVQVLEPTFRRKEANDLARVTMGISVDTLTNANYLNLYGSNVVVEVNDSGIDSTHPDFSLGGSVPNSTAGAGTRVFGDSLASLTDTYGHGTHVGGIIAGNGDMSLTVTATNPPSGSLTNADFRGKAPLASLFSVAFLENNDPVYDTAINTAFSDIADVSDYYLQTASVALTNALISNNSWVYAGDNAYDLAAASYDAAVRDALPMVPGSQPVLFVFAAGNDGDGNDAGSGADPDSIESPATAKNVITVGALQQFRNITNIVTDEYGNSNAVWQPETSSSSLVSDYSARGNVGVGVEGPSGRFKPDVVAPGNFVVSTRSSEFNENAYYNQTNYDTTYYQDEQVTTNGVDGLSYFNVSVPPTAIGITIQLYPNAQSPTPFPSNFPIYLEIANPPDPFNDPGDIDATVYGNPVNIPPSGPGNYLQSVITAGGLWVGVGDPTNYPVNYDISITVASTNDVGNYFLVLSNLNQTLAPWYLYDSGTSMATPAVAGELALIQDFFTNTLREIPSPALLKALVINGARATGSYEFAVTNPPNDMGWGLPNLPNSLPPILTNLVATPHPASTSFYWQDQSVTNALATGDSETFNVTVDPVAQAQPLRLTLTWTDPPGDPAAAIKLVNNVDIIVTNVNTGDVFYGNDFSTAGTPNYSLAAGTNGPPLLDVVNNVRNIYLSPPLGSNYTVTIFGRSVNVNAVTAQTNNVVQDFALVMSSGDAFDSVSNALTIVANPLVQNLTGDQDITFVTTTNAPLLNQIAGENTPLLGTNTVTVVNTNSPITSNSVVTVGMTNQWHFYVVTNFLGYQYAAFLTFFPYEMAVSRMGTLAGSVADATRPEGDIDLYVAQEPGLLNLDPTVISNCVNGVGGDAVSAGPGGTEFVAYSNSVQNQVYYIGVKSEDHLGVNYGFLPVFSASPFSTMNADGSESVYGLTLPVNIPPGSPTHPGSALIFALALSPLTINEVMVTNGIAHQNYGNLYGQLTHADIYDVLNNHNGLGNTTTPIYGTNILYYDAVNNPINTPIGPVTVPSPTHSTGPGSLTGYQGQSAIGPWILTEIDNVPQQLGSNTVFGLRIYPHTPADKGLTVYIAGQSSFNDYVDVPAGVTNFTLSVTNETLPTTTPPLELYLKYGAAPSPQPIPTVYDQMAGISNGIAPYVGGSVSVTPSTLPPIQPGRYYFEVYNPSTSPAKQVYIIANFQYAAVSGGATFLSGGAAPLKDDAVVTNSITITNTDLIYSAAVGVVVDHPRVSDLTLTLVDPLGERYALFENRGGPNATNLGHLNITTNFFGTVSSGTAVGSTNVLGPVPTQGVLIVNYDMYTVPDDLAVYYDGVKIFDSGYISLTGQFVIPYGPGTDTNITIVMDQGGDPNSTSLWTYTPQVVSENYTYVTFTDDTNFATIPIKFALPPFDLTEEGTNYTLNNFEGLTNGDYLAPTNIYDAFGGWTVPTNIPGVGTNIITLTNNEVSVVTDPFSSYDGSNFLALANGTITRTLTTIPTRQYSVSYSFRGPGIAGWWRGEGNANDSAYPETNGNNGLLIGRFNFPAGEVGQAFQMTDGGQNYQFAGTNNYVQVPQSPSLDVGTGSGLTVEGWINPTNLYTQEPLVEWLARVPTNSAITNIVILAGPFLNRSTSHYYYLLGQTNWTTSELWATNMGGHLVTINDANEQNWVYDTFADYGGTNRNLWLGLNNVADATRFVWTSGETPNYFNWQTGQPNDACGNYAVMLGATNGQPGLWYLADNLGRNCGLPATNNFGVVEVDALQPNGVQLWVSVTNSPATGAGILTSNGCLYANLVDSTNGIHEIYSLPGLIQSNVYQHVALTYNTNSGVATLYYNGTNVCSTNLGVFTPKTTGDILLGKDMSLLTNNYYSGEMDEMSVYRRALSDAEIAAIYSVSAQSTNDNTTNGPLATFGKFNPNYNPAQSLAEALVTLDGRTNLIFGDNTNWQRVTYTFQATTNSTVFQFTGLEPGMLLDDFSVSEAALGNVYYQPEQSLSGLVGESAAGTWTLEILDNRAGATNAIQSLVSWELNLQLETNTPVPLTLYPETPATNTIPPGDIAYFQVPVPNWAQFATNLVISATGPVNLYFNQTNLPTGAGPGDVTLLTGSGGIGLPTMMTNGIYPGNLPLYTNQTYYLGVQNVSGAPATVVVQVDYNITGLTNSAPYSSTLGTNDAVRYFYYDVGSNAFEATFQLLQLNGNADLVASYGTPLPTTTTSDYGSFNATNSDQNIYVQTNTLPQPLTPGRWYLGVYRIAAGPVSYSILAKELDTPTPNIITLTNNVPFNYTTGPGAALTNFFQFTVTNFAHNVHFELYHLTGDGDLTVQTQTNGLPLIPPFYESSQEPGLIPEIVYLRTNSALTNLNGTWYLGVPNHEITNINFTILAVIDTNGQSAFPGAVGTGSYAEGGRGSTNVYHVTTLYDDGPGSLRYGINTLTNTGNIVFDVSGNIALQSPLVITNSYLTIAGQTAPGDGITLQNYPTLLDGVSNVIIRFLRFRPGDTGTNLSLSITNLTPGDALALTNALNVIIDHVSASWSTNANLEVLNSSNITVQWSLIADSFHSTNGRAGQGAVLRYGGGALTFNHNLYADNYTASPLLGDNLGLDFVNNVIYNWGSLAGQSISNDIVANPAGSTNLLNYAANYVLASTNSQTNYIAFWGGSSNTWIFQTNNFIDAYTNQHVLGGITNYSLNGADTGWSMFTNKYTPFGDAFNLPQPTGTNVTFPSAAAEEAYQAYERVLDFAGAQASRDRVDLDTIRHLRTQSGQFIASETQVGGWPGLSSQPTPLDTDQDGIPDYWEITFGLNPTNAADGANIVTNTGYTELETYLNWLAGPHALTYGTNSVSVDLYHLAGGTGRLSFFVTNALNGTVVLTNAVYTDYYYNTNGIYTNQVVIHTNTLAIFTPTNGYTSSFTNPASFDFYVTNRDTVAYIGPITVSVVVSFTNITYSPTVIPLASGVPVTITNGSTGSSLNDVFTFDTTNSPGAVVFQLYGLSTNATLVVQTNGVPVPPNYFLTSSSTGTNPVQVLLQTNFALTNIGSLNLSNLNEQWYLGVTNNNGTNPITYTIVAIEIPTAPTIIDLTNNVPFTYTAGPGPDLTNFFRFTVSDSPNTVQFQLYNQSGNGDLTVQTNALPFAPLYYSASQQPGNNPEAIQVTTNGGPASLNQLWYLGVPNNDPAPITYTILAQEFTNPPPVNIPTNTPVTNILAAFSTNFYLVPVPAYATWVTNTLLFATGPLNLWFSTNTPATAGNPNDALLLGGVTNGISIFGTNATTELLGFAQLFPGSFYYLGVVNTNSYPVTNAIQVNFQLVNPAVSAPSVITKGATNLTAYTTTLLASVVPNGATTTVWFAYGLTTNTLTHSSAQLITNSFYATWPVAIGVAGLVPGNIYYYQAIATNSAGTNYGQFLTFTNPPAPPSVTTEAATSVGATGATLNAQVNPNGAASTVWFEYGTDTTYGAVTGVKQLTSNLNTPQLVTLPVTGLLPGVIYHYQAVGTNIAGTNYGGDLTFTNLAEAPTVITEAPANLTPTGATLEGLVTPNGAATTVYFNYGTDNTYGQVSGTTVLGNNLNTAQLAGVAIGGLKPGTTYHVQAVAFNSAGTSTGQDVAFITPPAAPTVITLPATNVVPNAATLPALVTPNGAVTEVYFEYGTANHYITNTPVTFLTGSLTTPQLVTNVITGLLPGVVYHYQAVAINSAGTNYGGDQSFGNPLVPVSFTSIVATNLGGTNGYLLSWYAPTNYQFNVQWTSAINLTNWSTFTNLVVYTGPATTTNGLFSYFDNGSQSGGLGSLRFYRLIDVLPVAYNQAPVLPPSGASYLVNPLTPLVVTNTANDPNPGAILTYSVTNTLTGTNLTVITTNGIITWTPTLAQAGLTNTITTIVSDNGVIPLTATNSFVVYVTPIPVFTSVVVGPEGVTLQWTAAANNQFQLGWTTNLLSPWTYIPTNAPYLTSPTTNFLYQDTNAATGMKFYQLRQLP